MTPAEGVDVNRARDCLRRADAVCFDVDSTLSPHEMIDRFAAFKSVYDEVCALTASAMTDGGGLTYRESFDRRMRLIQPTRQDLLQFAAGYPLQLTPNVADLVQMLTADGKHVYLVTGGIDEVVQRLAAQLQLPVGRIYSNRLLFDDDGRYLDFDHQRLTSDTHGKARVVDELRRKHDYKCIVMTGDGLTDVEAATTADAFIGYGGVQLRQAVRQRAHWYIYDWAEAIRVLK